MADLETEIEDIQRQDAEAQAYGGAKRKRKRDAEAIRKEQAVLEKELDKFSEVDKKGWILVDFPTNYA